ncbi:MAG: MFS transporter [Candidatus Malihini olakiniferum]
MMEGIGLSLFVVSWHAILNQMAHLRLFDAINESYVLSKNISRALGPAIGSIFSRLYGIQAAFVFPALLYTLCFLLSHRYRPQNHTQPLTQEQKPCAGAICQRFFIVRKAFLLSITSSFSVWDYSCRFGLPMPL